MLRSCGAGPEGTAEAMVADPAYHVSSSVRSAARALQRQSGRRLPHTLVSCPGDSASSSSCSDPDSQSEDDSDAEWTTDTGASVEYEVSWNTEDPLATGPSLDESMVLKSQVLRGAFHGAHDDSAVMSAGGGRQSTGATTPIPDGAQVFLDLTLANNLATDGGRAVRSPTARPRERARSSGPTRGWELEDTDDMQTRAPTLCRSTSLLRNTIFLSDDDVSDGPYDDYEDYRDTDSGIAYLNEPQSTASQSSSPRPSQVHEGDSREVSVGENNNGPETKILHPVPPPDRPAHNAGTGAARRLQKHSPSQVPSGEAQKTRPGHLATSTCVAHRDLSTFAVECGQIRLKVTIAGYRILVVLMGYTPK